MKTALALTGALALALLAAAAAQAQERLTLEEMEATRGGLMTPWGQEIGFGAVVRTYVDGELALQSQLTWTPEGAQRTYEVGAPTADLATAAAAFGLKVDPGAEGLLAPGDHGATVVLHDLGAERIAGLILNNADNRTVRQSTDVTLNIPGLEAAQRDMAASAMDSTLQNALGQALTGAIGR
jgi:hypothetical protein